MRWFAAHIVFYVEFKDGHQDRYPIWENIYLVSGNSEDDAFNVAEVIAKEYVAFPDDSFTWEGRPAIWSLGGIRKLVSICNGDADNSYPSSGSEITYCEFEIDSKDKLNKFINGETVEVTYVE